MEATSSAPEVVERKRWRSGDERRERNCVLAELKGLSGVSQLEVKTSIRMGSTHLDDDISSTPMMAVGAWVLV